MLPVSMMHPPTSLLLNVQQKDLPAMEMIPIYVVLQQQAQNWMLPVSMMHAPTSLLLNVQKKDLPAMEMIPIYVVLQQQAQNWMLPVSMMHAQTLAQEKRESRKNKVFYFFMTNMILSFHCEFIFIYIYEHFYYLFVTSQFIVATMHKNCCFLHHLIKKKHFPINTCNTYKIS